MDVFGSAPLATIYQVDSDHRTPAIIDTDAAHTRHIDTDAAHEPSQIATRHLPLPVSWTTRFPQCLSTDIDRVYRVESDSLGYADIPRADPTSTSGLDVSERIRGLGANSTPLV